MSRFRVASSLIPLALAACVPQPRVRPPVVRAPQPAPQVAPPQPADWRDRALAPGGWSYDGRQAQFAAEMTLTCDRPTGRVRLVWGGVTAETATVRTTYGDAMRRAVANAPGMELNFSARDPLLDQIAYSRGRWALIAGGRELIVPVGPEVARVVEDCR